jgi:hypothetical protein
LRVFSANFEEMAHRLQASDKRHQAAANPAA